MRVSVVVVALKEWQIVHGLRIVHGWKICGSWNGVSLRCWGFMGINPMDHTDMDELGQAVVLSLGPVGDSALKAQATAYCEQVKSSPGGWLICLERFVTLEDGGPLDKNSADLIRFFCLHVIEDTVKNRCEKPSP